MTRARVRWITVLALAVAVAAVGVLIRPSSRGDAVNHAHDGWNYRWPDRTDDVIRVWVQPLSSVPEHPDWVQAVREGFDAWADIGLPVSFTFVADSTRAEVHVVWVERFEARMTGRTDWQHDDDGWIRGGIIFLATHLPDGRLVTGAGLRAIVLHEIGHLLGLSHSTDSTSIMAADVRVSGLTERDRRTARLVYQVPAGPTGPSTVDWTP